MKMSLSKQDLTAFLLRQLETFFPDSHKVNEDEISGQLDTALQRVEYCFSKVNNRYFNDQDGVIFNHLNADQYAMFLYFVARALFIRGAEPRVCDKLFQLNRYLHGVDAFYEIELPDIFLFVHPLGTVLGRAKYSNYLLVYQRCSTGSNHDIFPTLSKYVSLHPGASIIGTCRIGENCKVSVDSTIVDQNLDRDSIFIGNSIDFTIKKSAKKPEIWQ